MERTPERVPSCKRNRARVERRQVWRAAPRAVVGGPRRKTLRDASLSDAAQASNAQPVEAMDSPVTAYQLMAAAYAGNKPPVPGDNESNLRPRHHTVHPESGATVPYDMATRTQGAAHLCRTTWPPAKNVLQGVAGSQA